MTLRNLGTSAASLNTTYARILSPSGDTTGATDTAVIQALWDAGKSVRLLNGQTYWVTGAVIKSNCRLFLDGATIKLPAAANTDVIVSDQFASWTGSTATGDVGTGVNRAGIYGPGIIDGNAANQTITGTTIAAGSNGATLPQATVNVASATNAPSSGTFSVLTSAGMQVVAYTGKTGTTFTGCTGGTGSMTTGTPVYWTGFGIRAFWYNPRITDIEVRNCVADGIWSEWNNSGTTAAKLDGAMEAHFDAIKSYANGRNGITNRGPHDSWWGRLLVFANGVSGLVTSGYGTAYYKQVHAWGTPQQISVDAYTETHIEGAALETTNVSASRGLRVNGVPVTARGRIIAPPGQISPLGGNIGLELRSSPTGCDIDLQIADCNNGALLTISDGGNNRIRIQASQTDGAAIVRMVTTVTSGSNAVNLNTFAGSGTLNVADTTSFPTAGAVMVSGSSGAKFVTYAGKTSTTLTGCTTAGSGTLTTGNTVTVVNNVSGGPANDPLTTTSSYEVVVGGGTTCRGFFTKHLARKTSATITPSATISTYGTPLTITPPGNRPGLSIDHFGVFSSAGLATETLTFQVTAIYDDGTTATTTPLGSITTNAASSNAGNTDIYGLMKDARTIVSLAIAVRSSIANSTASITAAFAGQF